MKQKKLTTIISSRDVHNIIILNRVFKDKCILNVCDIAIRDINELIELSEDCPIFMRDEVYRLVGLIEPMEFIAIIKDPANIINDSYEVSNDIEYIENLATNLRNKGFKVDIRILDKIL